MFGPWLMFRGTSEKGWGRFPNRSVGCPQPVPSCRRRGYCFIEFVSPQGALYALEAMNGHRLHGRGIKVGRPNNAANSISQGGDAG